MNTNKSLHGDGELIHRGKLMVFDGTKLVLSKRPHDGTRYLGKGGPRPSRRVRLKARYEARRCAGYYGAKAANALETKTPGDLELKDNPFEAVSRKYRGWLRRMWKCCLPIRNPSFRATRAERVASTQGQPLA